MDSIVGQMDAKKLQFRLDSTMASAGQAANRLSALSGRADSLMTRIQRNDGSLGRFMNDTTLYVNLTPDPAGDDRPAQRDQEESRQDRGHRQGILRSMR